MMTTVPQKERLLRLWLLTAVLVMGLSSLLDAGTVTYTYDEAGRLIRADYGDGRAITYTYDAAGNLLQSQASAQPTADLSITKADNPDPVTVGQKLTYSLTVTNNGPDVGG